MQICQNWDRGQHLVYFDRWKEMKGSGVLAPRGTAAPVEKGRLTVRARSPSSSLITAAKLLEVMSRNSQHLLIDRLSHPDVGCSWMADRSRFGW